jgi:hypothetical protein
MITRILILRKEVPLNITLKALDGYTLNNLDGMRVGPVSITPCAKRVRTDLNWGIFKNTKAFVTRQPVPIVVLQSSAD